MLMLVGASLQAAPRSDEEVVFSDYVDFFELGPSEGFPAMWDASSHQKLFVPVNAAPYFDLIGTTSAELLKFEGQDIKPDAGGKFSVRVRLPLEARPYELVAVTKEARSLYRFLCVWKKTPPSLKLKVLDAGKITSLADGFTGIFKPEGYAQVFSGEHAVSAAVVLERPNLSFRLFSPVRSDITVDRWELAVVDSNDRAVGKFGTSGPLPERVAFDEVLKEPLLPSTYFYRLTLFSGGKSLVGKDASIQLTPPPPSDWRVTEVSTSLNLARQNYRQTGVSPFYQTALQQAVGIRTTFPPLKGFEGRFDFSLTSLVLSSEVSGVRARSLDVAAGLGYPFLFEKSQLKIFFQVGYQHMFVTNGLFGISNVTYEAASAEWNYPLAEKHRLRTKARLGLMNEDFDVINFNHLVEGSLEWVLALGQFELGLGLGASYFTFHSESRAVDVSNYKYEFLANLTLPL